MREGLIGDVYMTRGLCYKFRNTIGRAKAEAVPAGVDYDLWLGPAPKREFTKNRFHYNWHWFWDTGNGDIGNQGIHEMDIARWGLKRDLPTSVVSTGGVQLGTRFACATESIAHPDFKKAFFRANARDAIASVQVDPRLPVIPVRALKNKGTEEFTAKQREVAALLDAGAVDMAEAQLQIEHFWAGALRRAVIDGDVENGSLMAGQSVGMVKAEEPVADIIAELMSQCEAALAR